jgi:hypothetical protein
MPNPNWTQSKPHNKGKSGATYSPQITPPMLESILRQVKVTGSNSNLSRNISRPFTTGGQPKNSTRQVKNNSRLLTAYRAKQGGPLDGTELQFHKYEEKLGKVSFHEKVELTAPAKPSPGSL